MSKNNWLKQADKLLFPDIEWARPETSRHAGKLTIIGGNAQSFAVPAQAFNDASRAGAGIIKVVLPDALQKTVGPLLPEADFAPSNPSGSFARSALGTWLEHAEWADAVLLAGDLGRNSETAIIIETFLNKCKTPVALTKDALDYCLDMPLLHRENTLVVASLGQLQKLITATQASQNISMGMDLLHIVERLQELSIGWQATVVVKHHETYLCVGRGIISSTTADKDTKRWQTSTAAVTATWWMQHPSKEFEAVTTGLYFLKKVV